jgi:hypothetical protein
MRGYAIGAPRLLDFTDIAEGTRGPAMTGKPLVALGLTDEGSVGPGIHLERIRMVFARDQSSYGILICLLILHKTLTGE